MRLARRALFAALTIFILLSAATAQTLRLGNDPRNQAPTVGTNDSPRGVPDENLAKQIGILGETRAANYLTRSEEAVRLIAPTKATAHKGEPTLSCTFFGSRNQSLMNTAFINARPQSGGAACNQ